MYRGFGISDIPTRVGGSKTKEYLYWVRMLDRCYDEKLLVRRKTYQDCEDSEQFRRLSDFSSWIRSQVGFNDSGFALDKDMLIKGNKIYSPDRCCLVPREINSLFTLGKAARGGYPLGVRYINLGTYHSSIHTDKKTKHLGVYQNMEDAFMAYKRVKEDHIKFIAEKWRGMVDENVYEKLMSWEIDIDD